MAISSSPGLEPTSRAWKTTPKDPFPIILQLLYEISFCSPVRSHATTLVTLEGSSIAVKGSEDG